jgi:hypothetical protein
MNPPDINTRRSLALAYLDTRGLRILSPTFRYIPSDQTNIVNTFRRITLETQTTSTPQTGTPGARASAAPSP